MDILITLQGEDKATVKGTDFLIFSNIIQSKYESYVHIFLSPKYFTSVPLLSLKGTLHYCLFEHNAFKPPSADPDPLHSRWGRGLPVRL